MPPIDFINPNVINLPTGSLPDNNDSIKLAREIPLLFQLNEQTQFAKVAGDLVASQCNINPPAGFPQPADVLKRIASIVAPGPGEPGAGTNVLEGTRQHLIELSNKITNLRNAYDASQLENVRLVNALNAANAALNSANAALQNVPVNTPNEFPPVGTQQTTTTTTSVTPVNSPPGSGPIQTVPVQTVPIIQTQPKTNYTTLIAGLAAVGILGAGAWYLYKNRPSAGAMENPLLISSPVKIVKKRKTRRIRKQ